MKNSTEILLFNKLENFKFSNSKNIMKILYLTYEHSLKNLKILKKEFNIELKIFNFYEKNYSYSSHDPKIIFPLFSIFSFRDWMCIYYDPDSGNWKIDYINLLHYFHNSHNKYIESNKDYSTDLNEQIKNMYLYELNFISKICQDDMLYILDQLI